MLLCICSAFGSILGKNDQKPIDQSIMKLSQAVYENLGKKTGRPFLRSEFMTWASASLSDYQDVSIETVFENFFLKGYCGSKNKSKQDNISVPKKDGGGGELSTHCDVKAAYDSSGGGGYDYGEVEETKADRSKTAQNYDNDKFDDIQNPNTLDENAGSTMMKESVTVDDTSSFDEQGYMKDGENGTTSVDLNPSITSQQLMDLSLTDESGNGGLVTGDN
jgi:hypothetical protein